MVEWPQLIISFHHQRSELFRTRNLHVGGNHCAGLLKLFPCSLVVFNKMMHDPGYCSAEKDKGEWLFPLRAGVLEDSLPGCSK